MTTTTVEELAATDEAAAADLLERRKEVGKIASLTAMSDWFKTGHGANFQTDQEAAQAAWNAAAADPAVGTAELLTTWVALKVANTRLTRVTFTHRRAMYQVSRRDTDPLDLPSYGDDLSVGWSLADALEQVIQARSAPVSALVTDLLNTAANASAAAQAKVK